MIALCISVCTRPVRLGRVATARTTFLRSTGLSRLAIEFAVVSLQIGDRDLPVAGLWAVSLASRSTAGVSRHRARPGRGRDRD